MHSGIHSFLVTSMKIKWKKWKSRGHRLQPCKWRSVLNLGSRLSLKISSFISISMSCFSEDGQLGKAFLSYFSIICVASTKLVPKKYKKITPRRGRKHREQRLIMRFFIVRVRIWRHWALKPPPPPPPDVTSSKVMRLGSTKVAYLRTVFRETYL